MHQNVDIRTGETQAPSFGGWYYFGNEWTCAVFPESPKTDSFGEQTRLIHSDNRYNDNIWIKFFMRSYTQASDENPQRAYGPYKTIEGAKGEHD